MMRHLLLDYLYRRRWYVLPPLAVTLATSTLGSPIQGTVFLFFVVTGTTFPAWERIAYTLPISTRQRLLAKWLMQVGLLPLLAFATIAIGALFAPWQPIHPMKWPWFGTAAAWCSVLGLLTFLDVLFKVFKYISRKLRPALKKAQAPLDAHLKNLGKPAILTLFWLFAIIVTILIVCAMGGLLYAIIFAPTRPETMRPIHWYISGTIPLWTLASMLTALANHQSLHLSGTANVSQLSATAVNSETQPTAPGTQGVRVLITKMYTFSSVMCCFLMLFISAVLWFLGELKIRHGENHVTDSPVSYIVSGIFAIMFGTQWLENFNLRTLRTLPLATGKLAWLLMGLPLFIGGLLSVILSTGIVPMKVPFAYPSLNAGLSAAAFGSLALALRLRFALPSLSLVTVLIAMTAAGNAAAMVEGSPQVRSLLIGVELLMLPFSYWLIMSTLRTSSKVYQPSRSPIALDNLMRKN